MGAGKSYIGVNWIIPDELKGSKRDVWTTLPIKADEIARSIGGRNQAKVRELRERLHVLEDKEKQVYENGKPKWIVEPVLDDQGNVVTEGKPYMLNEAKHFWRFTTPNSLIVVDEAADLWDARNWKKTHESGGSEFAGEFGVYIRQHRHYKDDFWVICHNLDDIDKQLRRKFHFIWTISNSRTENIFQSPWLRGIRWPIQFFIVRQYTYKNLKEPMEQFRIFPNAEGYRLYDSFSAASRLPGKELPPTDARSEDYKPSAWKRIFEALRAVKKIAFLILICGVGGAVVWYKGLAPMMGYGNTVMTKSIHSATGPTLQKPVHSNGAGVTPETIEVPFGPAKSTADAPAAPAVIATTAYVVFRSPRFVALSDGRRFEVGKNYDNKKLLRVDADGLYFSGGVFMAVTSR